MSYLNHVSILILAAGRAVVTRLIRLTTISTSPDNSSVERQRRPWLGVSTKQIFSCHFKLFTFVIGLYLKGKYLFIFSSELRQLLDSAPEAGPGGRPGCGEREDPLPRPHAHLLHRPEVCLQWNCKFFVRKYCKKL